MLKQWNPKITTPPGLYLTTLGFLKPFSELYAFGEEDPEKICPVIMLRFINILFSAANCYIMYLILSTNGNLLVNNQANNSSNQMNSMQSCSSCGETKVNRLMSALQLATFPPLFFFSFFYYTDPGSLFFVLLMYYYHINGHEWLASGFGLISLLYRQTNIIWLFFLASYTSIRILAKTNEKTKKKSNKIKNLLMSGFPQVLVTCGGYLISGLLFLIFLLWNKGKFEVPTFCMTNRPLINRNSFG